MDAATKNLEGQVALVAGATRGAGRGIARALGEAGAKVYCTGRSRPGSPSAYNRPETIDETAELVSKAGGHGIAVQVDHSRDDEVNDLFARIQKDEGRLDIVADSVAGETSALGAWASAWETDLSQGSAALEQVLLSHLITARHAAVVMRQQERGLMVQVVEGDLSYGSGGNILSDVVKSGLKILAFRVAYDLKNYKVVAVAVTPGFLRSESMLNYFGVTADNWRDGAKKDPHFLYSESPLFVGRAVVALACDKNRLARSGGLFSSWELARDYGFTDEDGTTPDWGVHFREILPTMSGFAEGYRFHAQWHEAMARRARWYLGEE